MQVLDVNGLSRFWAKIKAYVSTAVSTKAPAVVEVAATLTAAAWVGSAAPYTQAVAVTGVQQNSKGQSGFAQSATVAQRKAARKAQIQPTAQGTNTVTFTADGNKPTIDIPIVVQITG